LRREKAIVSPQFVFARCESAEASKNKSGWRQWSWYASSGWQK
jgi:hypothetical protein